jgi:hypothetical protein
VGKGITEAWQNVRATRTNSPATCIGNDMKTVIGNPSEGGLYQLCGAAEFDNADGNAPLYPSDKWLQQEAGKARAHGRYTFFITTLVVFIRLCA